MMIGYDVVANGHRLPEGFGVLFYLIIIIIITYLNCKWVFVRWQWHYNKTQRTTYITYNNTPR
jgi:hypothetical protein